MTYLSKLGYLLLVQKKKEKKSTKTFPLELEESLHKSLKVKAIEEDKTLHSLIIDTLSSRLLDNSKASGEGKDKLLRIK